MSEHHKAGPDSNESEFFLEVAPLAPPPDSGAQASQRARPPHRKRIVRAALVTGTIILTLAMLVGSYPPARHTLATWLLPRPTATSTTAPTPVLLGKVPASCPPGNPLETFSSAYSQGVGVANLHIWLVGFDGPTATARFTGGAAHTAHGWPYKVILVSAPDVSRPITLHAQGMFGVTDAVWFSVNGLANATAALTLNPYSTSPQEDGWRSWLFYLLIPSAGCYYLSIEYGDSTTTGTFFAAGV